jgi:hypothetical protein
LLLCGVFWKKLEPILKKILTKEASPATASEARHIAEKYSLIFSFSRAPDFFFS